MCASCVMFDMHLKHEIVPLDEGCKYLREAIKGSIDKNMLRPDFCEHHLLEIREYSLRLDKYRNDAIKKIEDNFGEIIQTIKKRKNEFLSDLIEKFREESEKIQADEHKWLDLQEKGKKVLDLSKNPYDGDILLNAKFVMDTLRELKNDTKFKSAKIYSAVDTSLPLDENTVLSYEQILHYLKTYFTIEEPNILEFTS